MRYLRFGLAFFLTASICGLIDAQPNSQQPRRKRLLAIGATKGFEHDSITNGLATMWKMGRDTGLWDTYICTDCELITKKNMPRETCNLDQLDEVFFFTTDEVNMNDS